ncbi:hypothetical protein AncyloWKF20_02950 [Ancylobacter sp. WKF20]|uniref:hypothetical protein n=1 Tax=Ancylobacter sp. WKF20 TaxID=3039801 RepID=UPI0024343FF9|nr:hypothetical protein [Ancylobacter sp. WKF20]WGD30813.1 hypothetical protein AncyloWKF20_02950 [Ancylobacter sp. WKF20]
MKSMADRCRMIPPAVARPARRAGCLAALVALALAGCSGPSSLLPPEMAKPIPPGQELVYPNFGAPAQIGDRPVMTPAQTAKMQNDLQGLAREQQQQVETDSQQQP